QPSFAKDFALRGTDAGVASDQMTEYFPAVMESEEKASTSVLIAADDGLEAHSERIDELVDALRGLPEVENAEDIVNPVEIGAMAEENAEGPEIDPEADPEAAAEAADDMAAAPQGLGDEGPGGVSEG